MKNRISAMKRIGVFALAIGMSGMVTSANAASDLSHCTDNSRECLVASAMSYINGLTQFDPAKPRFAPNVRRTLEGAKFSTGFAETSGEAALRATMNPPDPANPQVQKYLAEQKLTFQEFLAQRKGKKYIIESIVVDEHAGQVVVVWGGLTGKSMERFKVVKGLITEIESLDIDRKMTDSGLGWPAVQPCLKSGDGRLIPCDQ